MARIMPEIRDQHPRGEIGQSSAIGCPNMGAGAAGEDGLGWCEGSQAFGFRQGGMIPFTVGNRFMVMMDGLWCCFHGINFLPGAGPSFLKGIKPYWNKGLFFQMIPGISG